MEQAVRMPERSGRRGIGRAAWLAAIGFAAAFGPLAARGQAPDAATTAGSVPREYLVERGELIAMGGAGLGVAGACFSCHGLQGGGEQASGFPRLGGLSASYLAKQLHDYAGGSRPNAIMSPIAQALSPEEREAVALYYAALDTPPTPPRETADPALIQYGGVLYAQGSAELGIQACVNCHGPAGLGLAPYYPAIAGQPAAYTHLQFDLFREATRRNDVAAVMRGIANRMDERAVAAVSAYLANLAP